MRLILLAALTMVAFAANSVLNRLAVGGGHAGAVDFAVLRLAFGALALAAVLAVRSGGMAAALARGRGIAHVLAGPGWLLVYLFGFSLAYGALDAGVGALILFGTVQITMFAGALLRGEAVPARRGLGAALALGGLGLLLWPRQGPAGLDALHAGFMLAAGLGWGLYSLAGRAARDPLAATARNFVLALPAGLALWLVLPRAGPLPGAEGVALAALSGAVTSGLGYALWYAILPRLGAARAAVAQLSVPVIAGAGGALMLGEWPGTTVLLAAGVVLAGLALATVPGRR